MSIRKYTNPRELDLSPGLQDVLRRNGMQAHISANNDGSFNLIVLGHDSPVLKYPISDKQVELMMNWGNNYANKTAYKTFTDIVKNDFYMPDNFVSARNVGSKVVTGLHGYRIGVGEYGYNPGATHHFMHFGRFSRGWGGDFLGWAPRMAPGLNLRRVDGRLFYGHPSGPIVGDRPDGRMKPGELRSGGYGFYYKGHQNEISQDIVDDIEIDIKLKPLEGAPRPVGQAIPYNDAFSTSSDLYFSADKFKEVLSSHGLVIDEEKKTLTVMAGPTRVNCEYSLTDDEISKILFNDISKNKGVPVADRLAIINSIISVDYKDNVTMDMLNSKNLISIDFKPEVKEELEAAFIARDEQIRIQEQKAAERNAILAERAKEQQRLDEIASRIEKDPQAINGREIERILGNKAFFNQTRHGREVVVGEIRVDKVGDKFVMSAEINGTKVSHNISAQQFKNFIDLDDKSRFKMFDDIFNEVKIRSNSNATSISSSPQTITEFRQPFSLAENQAFINKDDFGKSRMGEGEWANKNAWNMALYAHGIDLSTNPHGYLLSVTDPDNGKVVSYEITREQYQKISGHASNIQDSKNLTFGESLNCINEVLLKNDPNAKPITFSFLCDKNVQIVESERIISGEEAAIRASRSNSANGTALEDGKGFYREIKNGREVEVGNIWVEKTDDGYKMSAEINGQVVTHNISQRQFDKFLAVDDGQRLKLFAKVFPEVDIKSSNNGEGKHVGAMILAAMVGISEAACDIAEIAQMNHHHQGGELIPGGGPTIYGKFGVVSPGEILDRNFNEEMSRAFGPEPGIHRGI